MTKLFFSAGICTDIFYRNSFSKLQKLMDEYSSDFSASSFNKKAFIQRMDNVIDSVCYSVFQEKDFVLRGRFLERFLFDITDYVISKEKPVSDMLFDILYEREIINNLTFYIDQCRETKSSESKIDKIIYSVRHKRYCNSIVFYLFRINKSYVSDNYPIDLDALSERELYFGISTGYFFYTGNEKSAYEKLLSGCLNYAKIIQSYALNHSESELGQSLFYLNKLKKDGLMDGYVFSCPDIGFFFEK